MRIHHVPRRFVTSSWGGTETYVLLAATGVRERGHAAEIFTSSALSQAGDDEIGGVPIHRFRHFYPYFGLSAEARHQMDLRGGNLFSVSLLTHLLSSPPPDIFHLHTGKRMGGIVRTAARFHKRPYVVSLHGGVRDVPSEEQRRWTNPTEGTLEWGKIIGALVGARSVLDDADAILCVSRTEQVLLQQRYPSKVVRWMPNSVPVSRYEKGNRHAFCQAHQIPESTKIILNVGRIDPQKNQLESVAIFERIGHRNPDAHLVLAGPVTDPGYLRNLNSRIENSPFASRIHRIGALPGGSQELVDAYHAASVFLLSSVHEPFGIVILEAWAAGLPVVATNVGGIPSFVQHRKNGMLYSRSDVTQAAEFAQLLLENPAVAEDLRKDASNTVRKYDINVSLDTLLGLYQDAIRNHRSHRCAATLGSAEELSKVRL